MPNRPHPYLKLVGGRIRERRLELDWTQERLAAEAGLDRGYISDIERGRRNLSLLALVRLARVLGTTVVSLLDETAA